MDGGVISENRMTKKLISANQEIIKNSNFEKSLSVCSAMQSRNLRLVLMARDCFVARLLAMTRKKQSVKSAEIKRAIRARISK